MTRRAAWFALAAITTVVAGVAFLVDARREMQRCAPAVAPAVPEYAPVPAAKKAFETTESPWPDPIRDPSIDSEAVSREFGIVRLLVLDRETCEPVAGAHVGFSWQSDDGHECWQYSTGDKTDASGRISIELEASVPRRIRFFRPTAGERAGDDAPVKAWMDGEILDLSPLAPGEARSLVMDLPPYEEHVFWGRVVSDETGVPIEGASIVARDVTRSSASADRRDDDRGLAATYSDPAGLFRVSVPSWQGFWIRVDAGGRGTRVASVREGHETADEARRIPMVAGAALRATVREAGGRPTAGATVRLRAWGGFLNDRPGDSLGLSDVFWQGVTDEEGTLTLEGLPAETPLDIEVCSGGRWTMQAAPISLSPGETRDWTRVLGTGITLTGRLVDQNEWTVAGCEVWLVPRERLQSGGDLALLRNEHERLAAHGRTDWEGVIRFADVAPGEYWIGPRPGSEHGVLRVSPAAMPLEVSSDVDQDVTVRAWCGLFVEGRVVDASGDARSNVRVGAVREGAGGFGECRTGKDGRFRLGPLPDASFRLMLLHEGGFVPPDGSVVVRAGDTDVLVRLE